MNAVDLFNRAKDKLAIWASRYSPQEYPRKVAINTVYELAILEAAWPALNEWCFNNVNESTPWEDAYTFLVHKGTAAIGQRIHGLIDEYLDERDHMSNLLMEPYRECLTRAINGSQRDLAIIENTYLVHFTSIYLVYAWAACGMTGMDRLEALQALQVSRLNGDYTDLVTVYSGMNLSAAVSSGRPFEIEAFAYTWASE